MGEAANGRKSPTQGKLSLYFYSWSLHMVVCNFWSRGLIGNSGWRHWLIIDYFKMLWINHTIIGVCWGHRQAVSDVFSVLQLLRRFSTNLNEIGHGQSVGSTVEGSKFWNSERLPWKFWNADFEGQFSREGLCFWGQDPIKDESYWPTNFLTISGFLSFCQFPRKQ